MKPIHHFKPTFKAFKRCHETHVLTHREGFASMWQWWVLRLFPDIGRPHWVSPAVVTLSSVITRGGKCFFNKMQACSTRLWLDGPSYTNQQFTDTKRAAQLSHLTCYTVLPQKIYHSLVSQFNSVTWELSCYFVVLPCSMSGLNQLIKELNKQQE